MAVSTIDALYNGTSEKLTTSATGITVTGTVAATAYTGDGSALTGVGSPSIDDNGNATAITIDSDENVGIGTSSSLTNLSVAGAESGVLSRVNVDVADSQNRTLTLSEQKITFAAPNTYGTNYNAFINYGLTSLQFGSGNTERIRIDSDGLKFHGDTAAANALNDYEEGTWTAGVSEGTIGGGDGIYVKAGDMVFCGVTIGNFSNTSSGNAIRITGLPFTTHSANHGSNGSVFCRYISGGFPDATQVDTSATTARMWKSGSTGWVSVNHNDITSGTNAYFFISLTYRAA